MILNLLKCDKSMVCCTFNDNFVETFIILSKKFFFDKSTINNIDDKSAFLLLLFGGHWVSLGATRSNHLHIGAISGYWCYLGVIRTILGPIRAVLGLLGVLWPHKAGANCLSGLCF